MTSNAISTSVIDKASDFVSVCALENEILKSPQVDMPVDHQFCDGLYARTMFIPEGTILTGAVHKSESFFVVRSGELLVTTDDGPLHIGSGFMSITKPLTKRAGVALTDVFVTTFHANPTGETDSDTIWDMLTLPNVEAALELAKKLELEMTK